MSLSSNLELALLIRPRESGLSHQQALSGSSLPRYELHLEDQMTLQRVYGSCTISGL